MAGYLVVAALVRMSQMLSLLSNIIELVKGGMSAYITNIVTKFFQPQAEEEWQAIVTAVSSVVGLFVFAAVLNDGLTAGSNNELQQSGVADAMASGAWLEVGNPYNDTGITEEAREWLNNLLVTSYVNRVFKDADAYIIFFPYKKYQYNGVYGRQEIMDFTQAECEKHWVGNPSWKYFTTCDTPIGSTPRMAVVTRPSSSGDGSKTWTSDVEWSWSQRAYTWVPRDFIAPAVTGSPKHGFGYNLTNIKFSDILNKGSQEAIEQWKI